MNRCFLDIETSGLDINTTAVIEVGYLVVDKHLNVLKERVYTLIPESIFIPYVWSEQAENVHGISEKEAKGHEYNHRSFCMQLIKDIQEDFPEGPAHIFGFNVGFDYWMLTRMFNKHDLKMPIYYSQGDLNSMGRILLGESYCNSRRIAEVLEITVDETLAHRALYDCHLGLKVFKGLKDISPSATITKMLKLKEEYDTLMGGTPDKEDVYDFMDKFFRSL